MSINVIYHLLLNLPRTVKRGIVIFSDVLICGLSVWIAFGLRLDQWGYFQSQHWFSFLIAISFSFPLFIFFGLYRAIFRYIGTAAFTSIVHLFIIYTGLFFGVFTLYGIHNVPRSIGVIQPMLLFIGIGISRYFVRYWLGGNNNFQKASHRAQRFALIYGAGSAGRQLASGLTRNKDILIKGFIDDDPNLQGSTINGISVYPNTGVEDLIHRLNITDVIMAIPSANQGRRNEIINSLNGRGVRVRNLPGPIDLATGRINISNLHDLDMNDLLGRAVVPPETGLLEKNILGKVVLVTGAGGSIGSELCRQIIKFYPKALILVDISENSLYLINEELKAILIGLEDKHSAGYGDDRAFSSSHSALPIQLVPCLVSVRDYEPLLKIFKAYKPAMVFHAAAYKHVPLVEQNQAEGIRNNVFGTHTCAQVSAECEVKNFILVSTDKAVRPTNVMGASKRIAELVLQSMADLSLKEGNATTFSMVRFGNVLGSSGSVVLLFRSQIAAGGPITLTHSDMTRYFMTIPEAAQLVIQASAMADGGDVFVLDMGEPVRIYDLAAKIVYLSGLIVKDESHPHGDIEIKVTGLRPGEKLYEELLIGDNPQPTPHPKIMKAHEAFLSWDELQQELEKLNLALDTCNDKLIRSILKKLVSGYQPYGAAADWNGGEGAPNP